MKKILAILGVLTFAIAGCGNEKADQYYANGIEVIKNGDYDTAITDMEQVIQAEERLPEAYRAYGIAWLAKKSYPEAIAAFSRSLNSMDNENEEFEKDVMYYLAESRLLQGEVDKALEVYGDILKMGKDPQAFFLRGKVYMNRNDYEND